MAMPTRHGPGNLNDMKQTVEIIEVSPRDGIQNEKTLLSTDAKLALINKAIAAGASRIEVTSFVNPKRVPQMADADAVAAGLPRDVRTKYVGLALNQRGVDRAADAGLDEINFVIAASNEFSERNQGVNTMAGVKAFQKAMDNHNSPARLGVSIATSFGCPFEGEVSIDHLLEIVSECVAADPFEIALADTVGVGTPKDVTERIDAVRQKFPDLPLRLHFHNTRNTGIANAWAGVQAGVTALDASFGGFGGCPFAPRATGNISTEDLVYMLERADIDTGMSLSQSIEAAEWLEKELHKEAPGMVMKAGGFPTQ